MSGIAELLVNMGHEVSGSDLASSPIARRLESLGARVSVGHDARNISHADLVVVSTAIPVENPERTAAVEQGIPVVSRGEMLAELAGLKRTIAVVGSHGKTTTTAMVALVLDTAGLDPTAVIGGRVRAFGSNARIGDGALMVVEADESDRSFLKLSPEIAVLTNIDDEHLDAYEGMADLEASFLEFSQRTAGDGCVVACTDDPRVRRMIRQVQGRVVTCAIDDASADVRASAVELGPTGSRFNVTSPTGERVDVELNEPGRHNVLNALAAIGVAVALDVPMAGVVVALRSFTGADRRFQVHGEVDGVLVIDDYAHHPTEIAAVIDTARLRAPGRLRVVFQPHRYSRTLRLLGQFAEVLGRADELILTEVYAASEAPIGGASAEALADAVIQTSTVPVLRVRSLDEVVDVVMRDARPGDIVLILGAGSIGTVAKRMVDALSHRAGKGVT
jgi:UDP-N-acetylmuramate--alanine ligase